MGSWHRFGAGVGRRRWSARLGSGLVAVATGAFAAPDPTAGAGVDATEGDDVRIERSAAAADATAAGATAGVERHLVRSAVDEAIEPGAWELRNDAGTWVHRVAGKRPEGAVVVLVGPGESMHAGVAGHLRSALPRLGWVTLAAALPQQRAPAGASPGIDVDAARERVTTLLSEAHGEATPVMLVAVGAAVGHEQVWLENIPVLPVEEVAGAAATDAPVNDSGPQQVRLAMAGYVRVGSLGPAPSTWHDSRLASLLLQPDRRIGRRWRSLADRNDRLMIQRWTTPRTEATHEQLARRIEHWFDARKQALTGG